MLHKLRVVVARKLKRYPQPQVWRDSKAFSKIFQIGPVMLPASLVCWLPQCCKYVTKMWQRCCKDVAKMSQRRGKDVAKMWQRCDKDVAKMWQRCGKYVAKMWQRCGKNAAKMLQRCGKDVAKMWQRCGKDVAKMLQRCVKDVAKNVEKPEWCERWRGVECPLFQTTQVLQTTRCLYTTRNLSADSTRKTQDIYVQYTWHLFIEYSTQRKLKNMSSLFFSF